MVVLHELLNGQKYKCNRFTFTVILIVMGSESEEDSSELSERGVFDELMKTVSPK